MIEFSKQSLSRCRIGFLSKLLALFSVNTGTKVKNILLVKLKEKLFVRIAWLAPTSQSVKTDFGNNTGSKLFRAWENSKDWIRRIKLAQFRKSLLIHILQSSGLTRSSKVCSKAGSFLLLALSSVPYFFFSRYGNKIIYITNRTSAQLRKVIKFKLRQFFIRLSDPIKKCVRLELHTVRHTNFRVSAIIISKHCHFEELIFVSYPYWHMPVRYGDAQQKENPGTRERCKIYKIHKALVRNRSLLRPRTRSKKPRIL